MADQASKGRGAAAPAAGAQQAAAAGQTRIVWDDTNMRSGYANVANVAGTREEIVLLFGMNQAWHAGQKDIKIQLMDRIVMSPFAAKRLSMLLNQVLQDYEKRYGQLEVTPAPRPDTTSVQ
ncbi:MAG: DUF3467 domain-containing protein [Desulfobacterota bacterium]|jgi:hypothetical protein|nr:DUF3467 domain-containing protein [Thermodesulfobacteriota bacterium]